MNQICVDMMLTHHTYRIHHRVDTLQ